jgi:hypothetical protein
MLLPASSRHLKEPAANDGPSRTITAFQWLRVGECRVFDFAAVLPLLLPPLAKAGTPIGNGGTRMDPANGYATRMSGRC